MGPVLPLVFSSGTGQSAGENVPIWVAVGCGIPWENDPTCACLQVYSCWHCASKAECPLPVGCIVLLLFLLSGQGRQHPVGHSLEATIFSPVHQFPAQELHHLWCVSSKALWAPVVRQVSIGCCSPLGGRFSFELRVATSVKDTL